MWVGKYEGSVLKFGCNPFPAPSIRKQLLTIWFHQKMLGPNIVHSVLRINSLQNGFRTRVITHEGVSFRCAACKLFLAPTGAETTSTTYCLQKMNQFRGKKNWPFTACKRISSIVFKSTVFKNNWDQECTRDAVLNPIHVHMCLLRRVWGKELCIFRCSKCTKRCSKNDVLQLYLGSSVRDQLP